MWNILLFLCILFMGTLTEASDLPSLINSVRINPPLDFCGEPVPLDDQRVRERLEKEMLLSLWDRAQVVLWMKRTGRYMPYIEKALRKNGMPDDLKYVAIVESALLPHVGSSKRAIGYWQFIRSTGKAYGLIINSDIDERRNIFKATDAAMSYLKKLYGDFGAWTLAAAAYNMGEYGLRSNIKFQKTDGYYHLYLPLETQRYIHKILAAKLILSNPGKYGFHMERSDFYKPTEFDRVQVAYDREIPIQMIAEASGTYYKTIKEMNPEIRGRNMPQGTYSVAIPKGAARDFHAKCKTLYQQWMADKKIKKKKAVGKKKKERKHYVVKRGDNLSQIAAKFKVSLSKLLKWNGLRKNKPLHVGKRLIVGK